MNSISDKRVLAIGIDAAEPTLIRQLIDKGELPALRALLDGGKWLRVESTAHIGSSSVWPGFITGEEPEHHGIYGEWCWRPRTLNFERFNGNALSPFWAPLAEDGLTVGILDVPFAPLVGLARGFEISEWGPHDLVRGQPDSSPPEIATLVRESPPHPFSSDRFNTGGPTDHAGLQRLSAGSLEGVRLRGALAQRLLTETRPRLALIVFTEIHHSGHYLWHNLGPDHDVYDRSPPGSTTNESTLKEIFREVDRQIGSLVTTAEADTVIVFSLHGMRAASGIPSFLGPLLCEKGFARLAGWSDQSWSGRAVNFMGALKRRSPKVMKKLYYRTLTPHATHLLARPTMMPAYAWASTRAFSLPSDQHGWIRVNLCGREARGIVTPAAYRQLCEDLEQLLRSLNTDDGRPLVSNVFRTADNAAQARSLSLPDLIVHWTSAALAADLRIEGSTVNSPPVGTKFTGQHGLEGFCIARGAEDLQKSDYVRGTELGQAISRILMSDML